ncbi:hypothetical protein PCG10_004427 [Penicillium crustosum]|uniref:Uncharacterized protein n=1 Tax=Penicillium crustosum TaxID=36656 RepID=A0A9P5GD97_PENCR|nr:uncharacterized protein N7487_000750 [Penicillium crustosum]KAF7514870.1 hypothetical protein PCG10_004427 [Penicillium crustosum]KAJ5417200.1 hypothetical protein N7487_000750 [Penicillium crustosum]
MPPACSAGWPCNSANNTPAPGSGEHYMISQELTRWYNEYHLHGRPAEHAAGTLASPWEILTLYHLPGAGHMAQKLPFACSAGRPNNTISMVGLLNTQQEHQPAPGRLQHYISQGLATWHKRCHLRVQQADHATFSNIELLGAGYIT